MYKMVYIIPLSRFGRICGVLSEGTVFLVEHSAKTDWASFKASELVAT